jgi:hypothetical protein
VPATNETAASVETTTVKITLDAREAALVTFTLRPYGLQLRGTVERNGAALEDLGQYDVRLTGWPDDKVRRLMEEVRAAADRYVGRARSGDSTQ